MILHWHPDHSAVALAHIFEYIILESQPPLKNGGSF